MTATSVEADPIGVIFPPRFAPKITAHHSSWASVQTYCTSLQSDVPTPPDVAHLTVMMDMRALELEHATRWGILASVFGHRVVTLGLTPVPGIDLTYGPASEPSDWYRSGGR